VGLKDFCNDVANHTGYFVGKSRNVLSSAQKKLKESTQALNPKILPKKIRNAIFEKLTRTLYKQAEFMMGKISERMEAIDEVARPFYEKVNALSTHGPVSETRLWQALNSIEAAKNLSDEEKALLVAIFGRIVGTQKSKVIDAVVVEKPAKTSVTNKNVALTGESNAN
jgi:hypothetical protein